VTAPPASFPATRRGRLTLVLLCAVQLLDVVDSSIMNVALPSIRRDLGFSAQGLQWCCRATWSPAHGTYPASLLPGLVIMAVGIGAVLVPVTTAANAGVPADKAGLAAGLLNASQQLGIAFGLAIFSATARTGRLLAARTPGMPRSPLGSTAPCWPARSSCSPPPSSPCAPPTAAASPSRQAAPTPPPARFPHRNWPTRPRPRQPRAARQRTASRSPHVKKS
jgi:hypothetical protein